MTLFRRRRRAATTASLTAVVLGLAAGTAGATGTAGAARSGSLRPPVIKESFTPLACPANASTTLGMEGCAEQQILRDDKQIDTLNADIFAKLNTTGKRDFIAANSAWFSYRKTEAKARSDADSGGSEAPVIAAQTDASLDQVQITNLKSFLADLKQ